MKITQQVQVQVLIKISTIMMTLKRITKALLRPHTRAQLTTSVVKMKTMLTLSIASIKTTTLRAHSIMETLE
jgi:hypothetical protein